MTAAPPAPKGTRLPRQGTTFVAGRGAVSTFGPHRGDLLEAVFAGTRGVAPRRRTAAFAAPTAVAAELDEATLSHLGGDTDLAFRCACAAAQEALAEAGDPPRDQVALILASTKADLSGILDAGDGLGLPARLGQRLVHALGLGTLLGAVSCACASGVVALTMAARHIQAGACKRVLVLGVDVLHEFVMAGFGSLNALDPEACRPFDASRRGISLGEAAAALLLTAHEHESIGAALVGAGGANDACHVTGPDRQGAGLARAAARAIAAAGLEPGAIDVVHLHGTATVANDATEAMGLRQVFGGQTPPAFGTKGQTGHTLGAAGILETMIAFEALRRRVAPANAGLVNPDVDAGLDLVRTPRPLARARHALKVASGFGGIQAAVVLRAWA